MRYGYAQTSNFYLQRVAIGSEVIEEAQGGRKAPGPLRRITGPLKAADELVVTEIDRLDRSTGEVILLSDEMISWFGSVQ